MAASRLSHAAKLLHYEIRVETQGAMGIETPLTAKEIATADVIIIAADIPIQNEKRFEKSAKVLRTTTKEAIANTQEVLRNAVLLAETVSSSHG